MLAADHIAMAVITAAFNPIRSTKRPAKGVVTAYASENADTSVPYCVLERWKVCLRVGATAASTWRSRKLRTLARTKTPIASQRKGRLETTRWTFFSWCSRIATLWGSCIDIGKIALNSTVVKATGGLTSTIG